MLERGHVYFDIPSSCKGDGIPQWFAAGDILRLSQPALHLSPLHALRIERGVAQVNALRLEFGDPARQLLAAKRSHGLLEGLLGTVPQVQCAEGRTQVDMDAGLPDAGDRLPQSSASGVRLCALELLLRPLPPCALLPEAL